MTTIGTSRRSSGREIVVPLVLTTLGTLGAVGSYFLVPGIQTLDVVLMIVIVLFAAWGYRSSLIRGLLSVLLLYVATSLAATFYVPVAPFVGAPFGDEVTGVILGASYLALAAIIWIALEMISRALIQDATLPAIGILDRLGGLMLYLIIGVVTASLLFSAAGYAPSLRRMHDRAFLRPTLNRVLAAVNTSQSFWFAGSPPQFYTYDLD